MAFNDFINQVVLNNTIQDWFFAFVILLLSYALLQLIKRFAANRLKRLAQRTITDVDDFIVELLGSTKSALLFVFSILFGSLRLDLSLALSQVIRLAAVFALLIQIGLWLTGGINYWVRRQAEKKELPGSETTTLNIVGLMLKIVVWILLLLVGLDNIPGVQITTLIASLGIGGIAVGLAVQNILGDIFASVSIALDKPFVIGDVIVVDDMTGTVEHIGLKSVRVRSIEGQQIVFSTSDLLSSRIHNYRQMERRRVVLKLGVSYNTPQEKVARIPEMIEEIISRQEQVTFDRTHFTTFGNFTLDFETVYYIEVPDINHYLDVQQTVGFAILERFEKEGIEMPYPTQTVLIDKLPQANGQAS